MKKNEFSTLKIENAVDRVTVASILFKNGYEVKTVKKKNGKKYDYFVGYRPSDYDDGKGEDSDES